MEMLVLFVLLSFVMLAGAAVLFCSLVFLVYFFEACGTTYCLLSAIVLALAGYGWWYVADALWARIVAM